MNKLKKIFLFIILLFFKWQFLYSFIYEDIPGINIVDGFKIASFPKSAEFLLNNKKIKIKSFLTEVHQGDVVGYYINYAREKKFEIIDNIYIKNLANIFLISEEKYFNPYFDYVFYIDEKKTGNLIAASTSFEKTKVIQIKLPMNIEKMFNLKKIKKLKLPDEVSGILYLKFPEEKSKYSFFYCGIFDTPNFNFVIAKWLKNLKNEKWQINDLKNNNINNKFYFFKKNNNEYFVTISFIENKYYLSIIG